MSETDTQKIACDSDIVQLVRTKKEYANLSEKFILCHVHEAIRLDVKLRESFYARKEATFKKLVKLVREEARKIYGVFQDPSLITTRKELLSETKLTDTDAIHTILSSHISTKERMESYAQFWEQILSLTNHPQSILDIGCGLNPVAYFFYTKAISTQYTACELSEYDAAQLESFFIVNNLRGANAVAFDAVRDLDAYPTQEYDVVLLLKALDTFERQKRYITYDILDRLHAKFIVATFPRSTVKGRRTDRGDQIMWFEKMLARKELSFSRVLLASEIAYICFKS